MSADAREGDPSDLAAAEYVLGTLSSEERTAFARRLADDAGLRARVQAWERHLAGLNGIAPEVPPPRGLWERIARALPQQGEVDARVADLRRQVRRWRAASAGAGLVAAGLASVVALAPSRAPEPPARTLAIVTSGGTLPALIVSIDAQAGTVDVRPVDAPTPEGRSLELWYVGADASPEPLGVVAQRARIALPTDARAGIAAGKGAFAVSVEPPGGAPNGRPTGPVIYSGKVIRD